MLVDEDKIQWDDRVVERLPGFQMYDTCVTHEITIRESVSSTGRISGFRSPGYGAIA